LKAKSPGYRAEITASEDRTCIADAVLAQFVDLRPVGAVVQDTDEDPKVVTPDRLQFLNMHEEAAVAVDDHDRIVGPGGCGARGIAEAIADRAKLADREERRGATAAHVGRESRTMTGAVDHHPLLRKHPVERWKGVARVHEFVAVERIGICRFACNAGSQLLGAVELLATGFLDPA